MLTATRWGDRRHRRRKTLTPACLRVGDGRLPPVFIILWPSRFEGHGNVPSPFLKRESACARLIPRSITVADEGLCERFRPLTRIDVKRPAIYGTGVVGLGLRLTEIAHSTRRLWARGRLGPSPPPPPLPASSARLLLHPHRRRRRMQRRNRPHARKNETQSHPMTSGFGGVAPNLLSASTCGPAQND